MSEHPFGWLSLLPPAVAILGAIVTRRVVPSLLLGVLVGALVLSRGAPLETIRLYVAELLWPSLVSSSRLYVFAFTLSMGAMVGIINRCGGMQGLVDSVSRFASTRRRGQLTGWVLGLFVFFDDYANTLLLGKTLQPLTDRLRISREKLAYIVDSTAAPVAGLALVSTWVATEIDYIAQGLGQIDPELSGRASGLFIASLPYRFYVWGALLLVPVLAVMGREFGPMLAAERRAWRGEKPEGPSEMALAPIDDTQPDLGTPARWFNAVLPVLATVGGVIFFLYESGLDPAATEPQTLQEIFGGADAFGSLLWGALIGLGTAVVLVVPQRLISLSDLSNAAWNGAVKMMPALTILWLAGALTTVTGGDANTTDGELAAVREQQIEWGAWVLGPDAERGDRAALTAGFARLAARPLDGSVLQGVADRLQLDESVRQEVLPEAAREAVASEAFPYRAYRLYTGDYLQALVGDALPRVWMPTVIFCLAGGIAFATGTSWGTMALVMPLAIPLAGSVELVEANDPLLLGVIGGVLAGAIFGDHCSPISDTTVLSSQSSGCDHMAHVSTQMPYALSVALVVVVLGTIPMGLGVSVWVLLPLQGLAVLAIVRWFGRPVDEVEVSQSPSP